MAEIFLSYASEDRDRVRPLAEALQARGFSVWWDRSIAAGDDFSAVIQRELAAAKAVIVIWTRTSAASVWVRDEAGRARDDGRLVPVMLDQVQIPLGFGAFQAEDFTRWNGSPQAAQMQLLEEALRARLEGRAVDAVAVAAKRRRLMNRIRVVSFLTAAAAVVGIGATVYNTFLRPQPQVVTDRSQENLAELLALVREGKITGDQAVLLIERLESQTFAEASTPPQNRSAQAGPSAPMADVVAPPAPGAGDSATMMAPSAPADDAAAQVASQAVSDQQFQTAARETFRSGMRELLTSDDPTVRSAALQLSNPSTRDQAIQTLWDWATAHPGPTQATIYQVCSAVAEANNHPDAQRFIERAREVSPDNPNVWRLYSYSLRRQQRTEEAGAAALVSQGLEAQASGDAQVAEQRLQRALPSLRSTEGRSFVESRLTRIRPDWRTRRLQQTTNDTPDARTDAQQTNTQQADQPARRPTRDRTY